jgi:uncharacterized protein (DUF488 family)
MSQTPIYTIGYGAREIEELIAVLQRHEIAFLIDVRSKPYSRYKPDFSKEALSQRLEREGIRYVFMGDTLGGQPDDPAYYSDGKVAYEELAKRPAYQQGLQRLQEAYRQQLPVVLMCSEGKPEMCHRSKLIGQSLSGDDIAVVHIDENDYLRTQSEVLLRLNKNQPSLFGDDFYRYSSRKRYQQEPDDD